METKPVLTGQVVILEPLEMRHAEGLISAVSPDLSLYQWSPVPQGKEEVHEYINTAAAWRDDGSALPFAIIRRSDSRIVGSTRIFNIERWAWPRNHDRHRRGFPDACEIGYTWLHSSAIRTGVNTEAKLLLLKLAFEQWKALRVCLHTDVRNARSRKAIERIGGKMEGILRAHRLAADFKPRDSARFSILEQEWPVTKARLESFLNR
jgi:RimJ/RimL family protein N-acetyltransferase